jgi:putative ABC transport system permease protein
MNTVSRGVRNAFRNPTRTISIAVILGLSIGLSLAMLIAHQAVAQKIQSVKASVGNTINITPAGYSGFSQVNNSLTASDLKSISKLSHVTSLTETLTDRLTTIGASQPSFGFGGGQSSNDNQNNQTSLTSPIKLNLNKAGPGQGQRFFVSGGGAAPTNFTPPISIVGTNDPTHVDGTAITLKSGKQIDPTKDSYSALVSSDMATKNSLKVGSTFTAYSKTLTVIGIFSSSNEAANGTVIVSLPSLQKLTGQSGDVTAAVANVDQLDNLASATTAIKKTLGSKADVTSAQDQANETVQPLNNVESISLYSLIGAVVAGAIIILLTMVMIVRERRREIGVIKAIGASNLKVMFQFMVESVTLTVIGAIIGIALGVVAANPITHQLVSSSTSSSSNSSSMSRPIGGAGGPAGNISFRTGGRGLGALRDNVSNIQAAVGWTIVLDGLAAAVIIALLGSSLASFFIAKIRPAEVLRTD